MLKKLLLLSFIEGAAVMAAELCGAKLLAPIFGNSLYVWASVLGITLFALAAGYFSGGYLSARTKSKEKILFQILSAASLFILAMPLLSYYVVPRISYLPFLPGVIISTFCLLFLPVFFLGASSPLFIMIQTKVADAAGQVSGAVYAISTVGGIFATFLCGFYLIPVMGLMITLLIFGSLLFLLNFLVFRTFKAGHFLFFIFFGYLNFQIAARPANSLEFSDSVLGHLEVSDHQNGNKSLRLLMINNIIQTEMDLKNHRSTSEYIKLLDSLTPLAASSSDAALVLGLGGGLTANLLTAKKYKTDGVEFDERIINCARKYFFLDRSVNAVHADARFFLNHCNKKYKVIIADLYKAEEQPSHVLTLESLELLKKNLEQNSLLLISWHGYLSGEKGRGTAILINTLKHCGYHVKLCSMSKEERSRNLIIVASLNDLPTLTHEITEGPEAVSMLNTDDQPLLEKYNAQANKDWRTQYLRYYQSK